MSSQAVDGEEEAADARSGALVRRVAAINPALRALPEIGQVVGGKYRIEALLGRGGMGGVFRALQIAHDKSLALKWMLHSTPDRRSHHRLMKEALAAGRVQHPNVVEVYDLGREGHFAFVTMELLHGESLRERLRRGPMPVAECLRLLLPALEGVRAMHRAGVFHRALTPDSFFLCLGADGAVREVKVLDFGVANVIEAATADPALEQADDAVRETLPYMAREQLERQSEIGGTADVYACGAVLYEALTGARPFRAHSRAELLRAIETERPTDPKMLRPELSSRLSRVLLRALGRRREHRFATMHELIAALAPFTAARDARRTWFWVLALVTLTALVAVWFTRLRSAAVYW
jgi:serine/threonine protein kinase